MKDKQAEGQVVNWRKGDIICFCIKILIRSALSAFLQEEWRLSNCLLLISSLLITKILPDTTVMIYKLLFVLVKKFFLCSG